MAIAKIVATCIKTVTGTIPAERHEIDYLPGRCHSMKLENSRPGTLRRPSHVINVDTCRLLRSPGVGVERAAAAAAGGSTVTCDTSLIRQC